MATFKVGQRVKNILDDSDLWYEWEDAEGLIVPIGAEGTIDEGPVLVCGKFAYGVVFDMAPECPVWCEQCELAPLTPPAADTWAADKVRELVKPRYVEPVAPNKVTARSGGQ